MATSKKKPVTVEEKKPAAKKAVVKKPAKTVIEPSTVKGNHLTVITDSEGKTTLIWDDEALLAEVRAALASVESKPKKTRAKKNA